MRIRLHTHVAQPMNQIKSTHTHTHTPRAQRIVTVARPCARVAFCREVDAHGKVHAKYRFSSVPITHKSGSYRVIPWDTVGGESPVPPWKAQADQHSAATA